MTRFKSGSSSIARHPARGIAGREVAFIVAAIAILLAVAIPYVYRQRTLQRRQVCEARQFRASLAMIQFSLDHQHLPGYRNVQATDRLGVNQPASWVFPILPYLHPIEVDLLSTLDESYTGPPVESGWTYQTKYDSLIGGAGPWAPINLRYGSAGESSERGARPDLYIPELICPGEVPFLSSHDKSFNSFVVNCGMPDAKATSQRPADWLANGVFTDQFPGANQLSPPTTLRYLEDGDGLGNVVMLSENVDGGFWTDSDESKTGFVWTTTHSSAPSDLVKDIWWINQNTGLGKGDIQSARPSSFHLNGVNVAMCDGSTRFIRRDIDALAWAWMLMSDSSNPKYPGTDEEIAPPYKREHLPTRHGADANVDPDPDGPISDDAEQENPSD